MTRTCRQHCERHHLHRSRFYPNHQRSVLECAPSVFRPTIKRPISQSVPPASLEIKDAVFQELIRISPASNYVAELVGGPGRLQSRGLLEDDVAATESIASNKQGRAITEHSRAPSKPITRKA